MVSTFCCGLVTNQRNDLKLRLQLIMIPSDGPGLTTSDVSPGRYKCTSLIEFIACIAIAFGHWCTEAHQD